MDENNEKKEGKSFNTYRTVSGYTEERKNVGFVKPVLLPFLSGILGACIIIGICFGIPEIKGKLLDVDTIVSTSSNTQNDNQAKNTDLVSLVDYSNTAIGVAEKIKPSIVGIEVEYSVNNFFVRNSSATAQGSGIIISEDGYILTNNHIVNNSGNSSYYEVSQASKIIVYLYNDDTPYEAKIVGTDKQTDLAVIKIEKTGLTKAELGNSSTTKVGEFAMAVGNPLGMRSSISCGVISALDREVTDSDGTVYTLIQTDAAINSGNSGGALVNSKGQVIGINTLKLSGTGVEGLGFAIPIDSTIDIYEQLIQYSKVKRPYIGIVGLDLTEELSKANNLVVGIYIKEVEDFSSAQKGELKVGDVITEANGTKVMKMEELNEIKNSLKIGDEITLKVYRNGKYIDIKIILQEQP